MKQYFVFSDIHGFYDELLEYLTKAGFEENNPEHIIISCGDLLDRGSKPRECIQFVNKLYAQNRAILIKGNHEVLLEEMLNRDYPMRHDYSNGTVKTVMEMFPDALDINEVWEAMKNDKDYLEYKSHLIDYYETDDYIFTHGWIPVSLKSISDNKWVPQYKHIYNPDWRNSNEVEWNDYPDGARWLNGIQCAHDGLNETGKTIVVGHYHTSYGHSRYEDGYEEFPPEADKEYLHHCFEPYKKDGLIAIDACTAYSGLINILVLSQL